jgi:hypothetical protein
MTKASEAAARGPKDPPHDRPFVRYRALSVAAVASLVFGVLSAATFFHWAMIFVPATGCLLGFIALRQIEQAPEEMTGRALAIAGLATSLGFWTLGYGWLIFDRVKEVPFGYERVTYEMLQPNPQKKTERIPPSVFELQGKKVFVVGYMQPSRQQVGLKTFVLCPAIPDCPFCTPDPKPTEMVQVNLEGDLRTDYTTFLVHVGGKLRVDPKPLDGLPYKIDADYLR